jgi:hypothetical protein
VVIIKCPKKPGRPLSANKRTNRVEVKMTDCEVSKLDFCADKKNSSRAKVIRDSVDVTFNRLYEESEN